MNVYETNAARCEVLPLIHRERLVVGGECRWRRFQMREDRPVAQIASGQFAPAIASAQMLLGIPVKTDDEP